MSHWLRYLLIQPLAFLLLVFVVLLLVSITVLYTQFGTQAMAQQAQQWVEGLHVDGVQGALGQNMQVDDLRWQDDEIRFEAQQVDLKTRLSLQGAQIQQLNIDTVKITNLKPSNDPTQLPVVSLPFDLQASELAIKRLEIINSVSGKVEHIKDIQAQVHSENGFLVIDHLTAKPFIAERELFAEGGGRIALLAPHDAELTLKIGSRANDAGLGQLDLALNGPVSDYQLTGGGEWRYRDYPKHQISLQSHGSLDQLSIDMLNIQADGHQFELKGEVSWLGDVIWDFSGEAENFNPAAFGLKAEGALDADFRFQGEDKEALSLKLEVRRLTGELQDYPVQAKGDVGLQNGVVALERFEARVGDNRLSAQGEAEDKLRVTWSLDAPDISQIAPELPGHLQGKGVLEGTPDASSLVVNMEQLQGRVANYDINVVGRLGLDDDVISARDVEVSIGNNLLTLNGDAKDALGLNWVLNAQDLAQLQPDMTGALKGQGQLEGRLDASNLNLMIESLEGEVQGFPVKAQGWIQRKNESFSAQNFLVDIGENRLTLNGEAAESLGVDWVLDARDVHQFNDQLPGVLKGSGNLKGLLDGSQLDLHIATLTGEIRDFPVSAQGNIRLRDEALSADDVIVNIGDNQLTLNGEAAESLGLDWVLAANNLSQFDPQLSGQLAGKGNLKGLLDGSRLDLQVLMLEGQVNDYPMDARGQIKLNNDAFSAHDVLVNVGDNRLTLNGEAGDDSGLDWSLEAKKLSQVSDKLTGSLAGNGNLKGLLDGSRLDLSIDRLQGRVQNYPLQARGLLKLRGDKFSAQDVVVDVGDNHLTLNGEAAENLGIDWFLEANQLSQLNPQLSGSLSGKGHLKGLLDGSQLDLKITRLSGEVRDFPVSAQGEIRLRDEALSAYELVVNMGDNHLTLNGKAAENLGLDWSLAANNLSQVDMQLEGSLRGKGNLKGLVDASQLDLTVDTLVGVVKGYSVEAKGIVALRDAVFTAQDFMVNIGDNRITLNGEAGDALGVDWSLDAKNLTQLQPSLTGRLRGKGKLEGRLDASSLDLRVTELSGEVAGFPLRAQGRIKREGDAFSAQNFVIDVGANRLTLDGMAAKSLGVDWRLNARDLRQIDDQLSGALKGSGNLKGLLDGSQLELQITQMNGQIRNFPVSVQGGVRLRDESLSADNVVVNIGKNRLVLNGEANGRSGLGWRLKADNLGQLSPELTGSLDGEGSLKGLMDGSQLEVAIGRLNGQVQGYPLHAAGGVKWHNDVLSVDQLRLSLGDNLAVLNGSLEGRSGVRWSLDAKNLAQIDKQLSGQLTGNGVVRGSLDGSDLDISISRLNGRLQDYAVNARGGVQLRNKQLIVNDLQVSLGDNRVMLNGNASSRAGLSWSLDAKQLQQIRPDLQGSFKGSGTVQGFSDGADIKVNIQQLTGKYQQRPVSLKGQLILRNGNPIANQLQVSSGANRMLLNGQLDEQQGISWSLDAGALASIDPSLTGNLKASGRVRGDLAKEQFIIDVGSLSGRVQQYPLAGKGQVIVRQQNIELNKFLVVSGKNQVLLNGQVKEKLDVIWSLDAKDLASFNKTVPGHLKGSGRVRGDLATQRFTVDVGGLSGRIRNYPITAKGQVDVRKQAFELRQFVLNSGQNRVLLSGKVADRIDLVWSLDARNLAQVDPQYKGAFKGNGRVRGQRDASELLIDVERLQGHVQGYPLQVKGQIQKKGDLFFASNGLVRAGGGNVLQVNGRVSEPYDLQWKINAPDLTKAYKGLAGSLKGQGSLRGRLPLPYVEGTLTGVNLRYQRSSVQALTMDIQQRQGRYALNGRLRGVNYEGNKFSQVVLEAQGLAENHSVRVNLTHADARVDLLAQGRWQQERWNGVVKQLSLTDTPAGRWQLSRPVNVQFGQGGFKLSESCLSNGSGSVCVSPSQNGGGTALVGRVQRMPLSVFKSSLPSNLILGGTVEADFNIRQQQGRNVGQVNIRLPDNVLQIRQSRGRIEKIRYRNAKVAIQLNDKVAQVNGQVSLEGRGEVRVDGRVDLVPDGNHRVNLRATMQSTSIAWVERLVPQLQSLGGKLSVDVQMGGVLRKPSIKGTMRLQGGKAYLAETGTALQDINLTVQSVNAQQANIHGTLRAGSGQMKASGSMDLAKLPNWSANVRLQGNRLLMMDTHEVRSWVSPDLTIQASPKVVKITGTVQVPETIVSLRELPRTAKTRSDDVVIVGRRAEQYRQQNPHVQGLSGKGRPNLTERDQPIYIQPNVNVILGDRVRFTGMGLDSRLQGRIHVVRTRQGIVGEGAVNLVNGVYKAYGQNLQIEQGRLLFNGPIDNPGFDLRAVRNIANSDIKVGISLRGTVRQPRSELFSSPSQTQSDTLSYLLTGRAMSGISGSETAILREAVTSLGVAGGEGIANQLGNAVGLDEVGINSRNGDYRQSELLLGKRLGPKLYIKYIVGLFDSLQRVAITYQVNEKVQLEAESGEQKGVNVIYKLETDRGPLR